MYKCITVLVLSFILQACTAINPKPDLAPKAQIYVLKSEFFALSKLVQSYSSQPFCQHTEILACADPNAVITLSQGLTDAKELLDAVDAAPSTDAAINAAALKVAVAKIYKLTVEEGILKDE